MKQILAFLVLGCLLLLDLPAQLRPMVDYDPGKVVFRVADLYKYGCTPVSTGVPAIDATLHSAGASGFRPMFPDAIRPDRVVNELGQKLADLGPIYEVDLQPGTDPFKVIQLLNNMPQVAWAEPFFLYAPMYDPADPDTANQYALGIIDAKKAWDLTKGDTHVVIAVTDLGTSFLHTDLAGIHKHNYLDPINGIDDDGDGYLDNFTGWDFGGALFTGPADNDPQYKDDYGVAAVDHGVLVTGTAGAATDNGIGMAGVGFNCKIMPLKINPDNTTLVNRGYNAIVYAANHGANIINCSWGGPNYSIMGQEVVTYAAVNRGSLIIVAGGNTPQDLRFYPACYEHVLGVAGTNATDLIWKDNVSFGSSFNYLLDISAPAKDIYTTMKDAGFFYATGTSLAAPIVCGVAGMVKSLFPSYTNIQVGEKVRITAENIYGLNPTKQDKMGFGRVNAYDALTKNSPSVRVAGYQISDGNDEVWNIGDTLRIGVNFINYLDPTTALTVTVSTPTPINLQVLNPNITLGAMGTLSSINNYLDPILVVIKPGTAANFNGYLKFDFLDGTYQDWQYIHFPVVPSFVTHQQNRIECSFNSTGRIGHPDMPNGALGAGFNFDVLGDMLSEGTFMMGTDANHVLDVGRRNSAGSVFDSDFSAVFPIYRQVPGLKSEEETHGRYTDATAGSAQLNVRINQHTYAFSDPGHDNYLICEYVIYNDSSGTLNNVYAGLMMDWDMPFNRYNGSHYDPSTRSVWIGDLFDVYYQYLGMSLLTADSLHGNAEFTDSIGFSGTDKFNAISSLPVNANLSGNDQDMVEWISAGPFNIAPGDSHIVAFALFGTDTLYSQIQTAYANSMERYHCLIRGTLPDVNIGPDQTFCDGTSSLLLDAGAGYSSYLWNTGAITQTLNATSSGRYYVTVSYPFGCSRTDSIDLQFNAPLSGGFTVSTTTPLTWQPVVFADTTTGAVSWFWDFGDGTTSILPNPTHYYTTSNLYTACLVVSNGSCTDTICTLISVSPSGIGSSLPEGFSVYPNPSNGEFWLETPLTSAGVWELWNAVGQRSASGSWNGTARIGVSTLPDGYYYLKVTDSVTGESFGQPVEIVSR